MVTNITQLDPAQRYTYADYLTWSLQERVELIMGRIFTMSPAPSTEHQRIVSALHGNFYQSLKGKDCRVFPSPFDVVLPSDSVEIDTVVQPDITVICDPSMITEKGCMGAPHLVVEVVSKASVRKDLHEKYSLYERAGVREYWLVLPAEKSLIIFTLDEQGRYRTAKPLTSGDRAVSHLLPDLQIDLDEIFPEGVEEPEEGYGMGMVRV